MYRVALRMLVGDTAKYLALIIGLTFSAMLVIQQGSIFTGIMRRIAAPIEGIPQPDIWVMYPGTKFYDDRNPLEARALNRVRGVPGVSWAEPLLVGGGTARLPDGTFAGVQIVGVDRETKLGLPRDFLSGKPGNIEGTDAILWDSLGNKQYDTVSVGEKLELNDKRAVVVGKVAGPRRFAGQAVVYTTYERALSYSPGGRKRLTFVLAKARPGVDPEELAERIRERTGLEAMTSQGFFWSTIAYFMRNSGASVNFAITVILGIVVGVAIAGQTFYAFTVENTRFFATLKAIGVTNRTLVRMVLLQALVVGLLGWGLGAGVAGLFGLRITERSAIAYQITPHLLALSFAIMLLTVLGAAVISIRRVMKVEPATVFR